MSRFSASTPARKINTTVQSPRSIYLTSPSSVETPPCSPMYSSNSHFKGRKTTATIPSSSSSPKKKPSSVTVVYTAIVAFAIINVVYLWSRLYDNSSHSNYYYNTGNGPLMGLFLQGNAEAEADSPSFLQSSRSSTSASSSLTRTQNQTPNKPPPPKKAIRFPFEAPNDAQTAVFYHIFIPNTPEGRANSLRIIKEQLQQLKDSQAKLTVYYNTIGGDSFDEDLNSSSHILAACQELALSCHAMEHFPQGMEDKTLQRLHDYCTLHPHNQVIYLHNKGSFTTKPLNEAWRYQMTQATSSAQCLEATSNVDNNNDEDSCNLCGLFFTADRGLFMAGNMWTSHCSYIQQLLPLDDFTHAMHDVTSQALMERLRFKLLMTLQELRAGVFGIDRFATEFWVGSHPSIRPCDFSRVVELLPEKPDLTDSFLRWLRLMDKDYKHPLDPTWFVRNAPIHPLRWLDHWGVEQYEDVRLREFFLLPGNLFKWYALYKEAPPLDSWIYQWFPDGSIWQDAIKKHGNASVDIITSKALQTEAKSQRNRFTADHTSDNTTKKRKKTQNNNNNHKMGTGKVVKAVKR